jgi:membrane dipeptidase
MNRREFLRASAALGFGLALPARAAGSPALTHADMHSHIGAATLDLREAMIRNRMLLIARTQSADRPVIRNEPGKGFRQVRDPQPGELAASFEARMQRVRERNRRDNLAEVTSASLLERLRAANEPGVVLAAEGADFLEGDLGKLAAARVRGIVHVQLVHYRVSEIGDISTAMPVHGGLTAFGKDVVRECNRLGILVDVAHATHEAMEQALEISTRPIVYSHGHVIAGTPHWTNGARRARAISKDMARRIAERGGVVGIWTPRSQYRSFDGYADALVETAAMLGASHVGVGTDIGGIPGGSVVPNYDEFGRLDEALATRGVSAADIEAMLGGNYVRVLAQALGGEVSAGSTPGSDPKEAGVRPLGSRGDP